MTVRRRATRTRRRCGLSTAAGRKCRNVIRNDGLTEACHVHAEHRPGYTAECGCKGFLVCEQCCIWGVCVDPALHWRSGKWRLQALNPCQKHKGMWRPSVSVRPLDKKEIPEFPRKSTKDRSEYQEEYESQGGRVWSELGHTRRMNGRFL